MSRLWHAYIRSGLLFQALISLLIMAILTLVFVALAVVGTAERSFTLPAVVSDLVFGNPRIDIPSTLKALYHASLLIVLAIWQAVFLARLLTRPHDFRFSKHAALYPFNPLKRPDSDPLIVFRLLNEGSTDLYNVEIDVTLRVFNPHTSVFQHFKCSVMNNKIPVFRRAMPFWIAIEVGETFIRWEQDAEPLDRCYLFSAPPSSDRAVRKIDADYSNAICLEHDLPDETFCLIVYVRGHDLEMDQEKAGVTTYPIANVQRGFFRSIPPARSRNAKRARTPAFFEKNVIDAHFDTIEPWLEPALKAPGAKSRSGRSRKGPGPA